MHKYILFILLIFLIAKTSLAQSENITVIRLLAEITVTKDKLKLGEIADITASEEKIEEILENVSLGYSPQVGLVREISRDKVKLAIASAGVPNNQIQLDMPESIIVRRASQEIDLEVIRQEVERISLSDLEASGATARLVRLDLPAQVLVPAGEVEINVVIPAVRNAFAPFVVLIEIRVDKVLVRRLNTNAEIEAYASVVMANKLLKAGTVLRSEDVTIEPIRLKFPINQYIRDLKTLRGVSLAKNISQGEPILTGNIVPSIVVKQGDLVQVIATNNKLTIQAKAEAITAGRIGDRIKIKSAFSETLLDAIVVDEGVVKVSF